MSITDSAERNKRFYIATARHVLCIDQVTGKTLWQAEIDSGYGGLMTLLLYRDLIFAFQHGCAAALDMETGKIGWLSSIDELGSPAAVALDPEMGEGLLIVAASGLLFGIDAGSGELLWKNGLKGLGYDDICLRAPGLIVAHPEVTKITSGKTTVTKMLDNWQTPG